MKRVRLKAIHFELFMGVYLVGLWVIYEEGVAQYYSSPNIRL